jgi:ubiquitin-like 1-activating enzyme E1 B
MALRCGDDLADKVRKSKVLVVGAGGIGCELLKNLVLTGFNDIYVIDLDTIDVSNLNRQFLFQKKHVGRSKSEVAKESALLFNPSVNITSYHDSIFNPEYNVSFFKQFDVVMNALDNKAARNHVNRLCLAADVPLVESGTAGYLGQVTVIKKGLSECYECQPKPAAKTYPGCTIRNTPSEPIHCIVWAKHLFNQLFGEPDADQDVSPDTEDPELQNEAPETSPEEPLGKRSTRQWAESITYNPREIFSKLFCDDIEYLLTMDKLWQQRTPPTPLHLDHLPQETREEGTLVEMQDQRIWTIGECAEVFVKSIKQLSERYTREGELVWDKDNQSDMDFVSAAANIRSNIFGIPPKNRFDIKSMAGNIIPAIATTNAVIAGVIVIEGLKILSGRLGDCKTVGDYGMTL